MVCIFILLVFTGGQFFLADALSGRDKALQELQQQVSELSDLLALERSTGENLSSQLKASLAERDALQAQLAELTARATQQTAAANQAAGALRQRADQATRALAA